MSALGLPRAPVAILISLAHHGGSAAAAELFADTGLTKATTSRSLSQLHAHGYVTSDRPPTRGGAPITWTLQYTALTDGLNALAEATRPHPPR